MKIRRPNKLVLAVWIAFAALMPVGLIARITGQPWGGYLELTGAVGFTVTGLLIFSFIPRT
jgi:hypothetical protein